MCPVLQNSIFLHPICNKLLLNYFKLLLRYFFYTVPTKQINTLNTEMRFHYHKNLCKQPDAEQRARLLCGLFLTCLHFAGMKYFAMMGK